MKRNLISLAMVIAILGMGVELRPLSAAEHRIESPGDRAAGSAAGATEGTTAKVRIEATSVGLGLGVTWGDGVLEYRGKQYKFSVRGFSVGDVGVAKASAKGEVYNLHKVEDFTGRFVAAVAGLAVGGGASASAMTNQNAVRMVLTSTMQGINVSLAQSGLAINLDDESRVRRNVRVNTSGSDASPVLHPEPGR